MTHLRRILSIAVFGIAVTATTLAAATSASATPNRNWTRTTIILAGVVFHPHGDEWIRDPRLAEPKPAVSASLEREADAESHQHRAGQTLNASAPWSLHEGTPGAGDNEREQ